MQIESSNLIETELHKLFALQDKPATKEKISIFVDELEKSVFPEGAIIQGIRALRTEDLKSIKISTIMDAARRFVVPQNELQRCSECSQGVVPVRDDKGIWRGYACSCSAGQNVHRSQRLRFWNEGAPTLRVV